MGIISKLDCTCINSRGDRSGFKCIFWEPDVVGGFFAWEFTINRCFHCGIQYYCSALLFALYLLLAIALFSANLRLYIRLPLLAIGAMVVILRSLYLRFRSWEMIWAVVSSLIVSEIAVGLHYLPLTPIQNGMLLAGMAYALTSIVMGIKESRQGTAFWIEPISMFVLFVLVSFIWG